MKNIILVIENGNSLAVKAAQQFEADGDVVFRCERYPDENQREQLVEQLTQLEGRLDLLLFGAGSPEADGVIGSGHDTAQLLDCVSDAIYGMQEAVEAMLPLLRKSTMKRIGMITYRCSSIGYCENRKDFGRHMSLAGLNMEGKLFFNRLRPEGFTFRWYCAQEEETSGEEGICAAEYMKLGLCCDEKEPYIHSDENRLVMRDRHFREIPW